MKIVKPLVSVMTAVEIYFITIDSSCVVISTSRFGAKSLGFTSADQIVEVEYIQIIECLLSVPTAEDVQEVTDFVAGVSGPTTRWVILG